jgi:hypothetical protein
VRWLYSLIAVVCVACSGQPQHPAPVSSSQNAAPVANPGPAGAPAASATSTVSPELNAKLVHEGYRTMLYHGQQLYCREESVTGTNFQHKVCQTAEQIRDQEVSAQEMLNNVQRNVGGCNAQVKCN